MADTTTPPVITRRLGRSRRYTPADMPARLREWHAPRANRWEHLCVTSGTLDIAQLGADGVENQRLHSGDSRWMSPGTRWRVTQMQAQTSFELEIHADDTVAAGSPQVARSAWLDQCACVELADGAALARLLVDLRAGEPRLARGRFDFNATLRDALADGKPTFFWHLLDSRDGHFSAFIARAAQPIGLLEYLGRDHAVIEATLDGALRGETKHVNWLRTALGRHLSIEEDLLFPAYLRAGGREGWVRGLCNEHTHLRRQMEALSEPLAQRKFLLLLDGHDEKEEHLVYPDILARLGAEAEALTRAAILHPAPLPSN
ncbi:MAG TPA: hemerythrin domain-containing protein [Rudaea sp.]|nr:hemerythrin domain-containing protein [Rudaea sp.]